MRNKLKSWGIGIAVAIALLISTGFQSDFFEIAKQIDIYTTLFKELNMYYIDEINPAKITNKSINHMLENLDPYTRYYDEQGVEDARISSSGEFGGIGIVTKYTDSYLSIIEIVKNGPAQKVGLKHGDRILEIDNVPISSFGEQGATTLLNGAAGSNVNLKLQRQNQEIEVVVERKKIVVNPVPYYTMLDDEVGYISFTQFNEKAAYEVKKAMDDLKEEGMKKLIIDVRSNPGGLLNEAVKITNFFIPKNKIVVTTKSKTEKLSDTYKTSKDPIDLELPIAILVNNRSASASEILAGSLQDYDRAIVVGERSFGKGLVQRYRPLSYGAQMKITISKYYTPSGRCIQELDYTNRDEEGSVPKFSDSGRKAFKTEKGRTVYGGGGIQPDVEIAKPITTETTEIMLKSEAFFNYGTAYFFKNKEIGEPSSFTMKQSDYTDLRSYLSKHQNDFKTETELKFEDSYEKAISENLIGQFKQNYSSLMEAIQKEKLKQLDKNKNEILDKLTSEIVKRYHYEEGVYIQKSNNDKTITKALSILKDTNTYNQILSQ